MNRAEENALIEKIKKGDVHAFGRLYELHFEVIYRFLLFRLRNHYDAEDLTEATFVKAWEHIGGFKPKASFRSWIFKIAHNLLIDFTRKKPILSLENVEEPGYLADVEEKFYLDYEKQRLHLAIGKIPAHYQQVIILRYLEEWEYDEIAQVAGKNQGAVRVMISRALKMLKEELEK